MISPRMEINLRRLAARDPKPLHLPLVQAEQLVRRGWITAEPLRASVHAVCTLTDAGREAAEAL